MAKKENVLAIMLGGKAPKKSKKSKKKNEEKDYHDDESYGEDYGEAFEESAEEAFQALKDDDSETFVSALKDAIHLCIEDDEE